MNDLTGKTALITGGARGFGRAIALLLARHGADVAIADIARELPSEHIHGMSDRQRLQRTREEVEALGRTAITIEADVTNSGDCERMAAEAIAGLGHVDILCANAGVFSLARSWELTEDEWDTVLGVNLKGVWLATKYLVPHMIERRSGKIVITSSRDGLRAEANYAHYNASKFGVIGYMKSLAIELGPYGINVNAVCPTQMTDRSAARTGGSETHEYWDQVTGKPNSTWEEFDAASGKENLFEDGGQPDFGDVAEGVLWLAASGSRLVTGHAPPLDAGCIAKRGG